MLLFFVVVVIVFYFLANWLQSLYRRYTYACTCIFIKAQDVTVYFRDVELTILICEYHSIKCPCFDEICENDTYTCNDRRICKGRRLSERYCWFHTFFLDIGSEWGEGRYSLNEPLWRKQHRVELCKKSSTLVTIKDFISYKFSRNKR